MITGDHQIVEDILRKGGKPPSHSNNWLCWDKYVGKYVEINIFRMYWNHMNKIEHTDDWNDNVDNMINLIMCSGVKIKDNKIIIHSTDRKSIYANNKINLCYYLLNRNNSSFKMNSTKEFDEKVIELKDQIDRLRDDLIKTIDALTNDSTKKDRTIEQIDNGILKMIPLQLVGIISDYQIEESMVEFIDWSKY